MAATVLWNGYGNVATADSTTGWTALKISGSGGGPTAAVADGQIEGTGAVTCTVNKQLVALYYDIGSGNELDFSGGGAEENELVYVWGNFLAAALLNNQSAGGFGIFLESSTPTASQYHLFYYYGADNYAGGWKRMVLDPTGTVSASAGTAINLASVRYFGVFGDVGGTTARFDNLICDAIDVGTGLRVYGTSTTDDLKADLIADEATNRYGVFTALNDSESAFELAGTLELGDGTGTNAATLTDIDAKIFLAEPLYYDGTSVTNAIPTDFFSINCVGNATGATDITIGKKVGTGDTARGRNGWIVVGNTTYALSVDWDDGNVNANKWYGSTLEGCTGTLSWGSTAAHECIGNNFTACAQFDPVGGIEVRNCNFISVADAGVTNYAALLWNASIDIQNCNFISNTDGGANVAHDIEVVAASTISFIGLLTSGAEQEVFYSAATGNLIINQSGGSNFSTTAADHTVTGTGTITINNNVSVTLTGMKDDTEVRVYEAGTSTAVDGIEDVTAGTTDNRSFTFSDSASDSVDIVIHNIGYEYQRINSFTIPTSDTSIPIQQRLDRNYDNP